MLLKDFYHITRFEAADQEFNAGIRLNPEHDIYRGHFPGQPVVPGVVQLQIIKELLEQALATELQITEVVVAKYPNMITPDRHQLLNIQLKWIMNEGDEYLINASIHDGTTVFTKLKAKLIKPA